MLARTVILNAYWGCFRNLALRSKKQINIPNNVSAIKATFSSVKEHSIANGRNTGRVYEI